MFNVTVALTTENLLFSDLDESEVAAILDTVAAAKESNNLAVIMEKGISKDHYLNPAHIVAVQVTEWDGFFPKKR